MSLEYIALKLISTECDFFRELLCLIQTPENAYGIASITNLPDETFVYIRQEHTRFGLSIKEIQGRIAFHVLAIWYILAKGKYHIIPGIEEMFHDLELEDEYAEIIDKFPGVVDRNLRDNRTANKIQMGTKVLRKGQKSKSSSTDSQSNCSSMHPLSPFIENWEIMDMEERIPELVDDSENEVSSTKENQQSQPLRIFGQAQLNKMGATTDDLGQSVNVTFEVDNGNSRNTPPNPHVLLKNLKKKST